MSVLEGMAIVCSVVGIYILVSQPALGRRVEIGPLSVSVLFGAGSLLAATGLLLLLCFGTWPAEWWRWDNSLLVSERPPDDSPGPVALWMESPLFWLVSLLAIGGAVGVVAARQETTFQLAVSVFTLAAAMLLAVASDWAGASILAAIGIGFVWRVLNAEPAETQMPDGLSVARSAPQESSRGEPFLATAICVLLAWGLIGGLHHSATNEAGPELASSDAGPALPRPVREETRKANDEHDALDADQKSSEGWLIGIAAGLVLLTGFLGRIEPRKKRKE